MIAIIITTTTYCCIIILIFGIAFLVFDLFLPLQYYMTMVSMSQSGGGSHWQISELGVWALVHTNTSVLNAYFGHLIQYYLPYNILTQLFRLGQ